MPELPNVHASQQTGSQREASALILGDLSIELDEMRATIAGKPVALTAQEFSVLVLLARDAGSPVPFGRLALELWQEHAPSDEQKRHLSVVIARLRTKLGGSKAHRLEAVRKRGYGLMPVSNNKIEAIKSVKDGLDVLDHIYW
jgi:DNA-binding response OmpR family regulator